MILFALVIGAILIVAAVRNSQGALFSALYQDVPGYVVWAAAIFAVGAIGFIPGLKPVSRGLLALVIVTIVLRNYNQIIHGFQDAWSNPPAADPNAPAPTATASNGSAASGALNSSDINNLASLGESAFGSSAASSAGSSSAGSFIDAGTAEAAVA